MKKTIIGIEIAQLMYKQALYADDSVFFLTNLLKTLPWLHDILMIFGRISGYKINYEKSNLMGINIPDLLKEAVKQVCRARWENDFVRYLGINISVDFSKLILNNFILLVNSSQKHLLIGWNWSFLGWDSHNKDGDIPRFLFLFQNLLVDLPNSLFTQIQRLFNKFV